MKRDREKEIRMEAIRKIEKYERRKIERENREFSILDGRCIVVGGVVKLSELNNDDKINKILRLSRHEPVIAPPPLKSHKQ